MLYLIYKGGINMTEFLKNHKKACIVFGMIAAAVIFAAYLYALFLPGYWYGDVFLYKEKSPFEGMSVFSGHDSYYGADYEMTIAKEGKTAYMVFTVNETERSYEITSDDSVDHNPDVTIVENGEIIFSGTTKSGFLFDENDELFEPPITISYDTYEPTEEELFPSYTWLYGVSRSVKTETRGEPVWLLFIAVVSAVLILDIVNPDLFWKMRHWMDVEGGEPSGFYRFMQKAGRILALAATAVFMILTFTMRV